MVPRLAVGHLTARRHASLSFFHRKHEVVEHNEDEGVAHSFGFRCHGRVRAGVEAQLIGDIDDTDRTTLIEAY